MVKKYDSSSIVNSEYPEIVRLRPAMFTGNVGITGNNHLAREIYDNSIDEVMNGYADQVIIEISNSKSYCLVTDNGRGAPMDNGGSEKIYATLYASGKYDKESYDISGGLHGVGASITTALSTELHVEVFRDGYKWNQSFSKGKATNKLTKKKLADKNKTGTTVMFKPDPEIMGTNQFNIDDIKEDVMMRSYLNKGMKIIFKDVDAGTVDTFYHEEGIQEYVADTVPNKITPIVHFSSSESFDDNERVDLEVAFTYSDGHEEELVSFVNSIKTIEGGEHETGFRYGVADAFRNYIDEHVTLTNKQKQLEITGEDYRSGMHVIVSVAISNPEFGGQHKARLGNSEVNPIIRSLTRTKILDFLIENDKAAKIIMNKIIASASARKAAKQARELVVKQGNNELTAVSDLGKLSDCITKDPDKAEIFIVEGDSAGGNAKQCRDIETQAIYPLKGKPLNTHNLRELNVLKNVELRDLTYTLTRDIQCIGSKFDVNKLKYGKIILMSDADSDGLHIEGLMITYFFKHFPGLIESGKLYLAQPPLYSIERGGKTEFFLDEKAWQEFINNEIRNLFKVKTIDNKTIRLTDAFIDKLSTYNKEVTSIINEYNIDKFLLNEATVIYRANPHNPRKAMEEVFTEVIFEEQGGILTLNGIVNGNKYVNVAYDLLLDLVKTMSDFLDRLELRDTYNYDYRNDTYKTNPYDLYDIMLDKSTPKSRNRLKGLGEMDKDDLWTTTMDPANRKLVQVTMDDVESSENIIQMLFDSRTKFSDDRKKFLLEVQDEYNSDMLDLV